MHHYDPAHGPTSTAIDSANAKKAILHKIDIGAKGTEPQTAGTGNDEHGSR